MKIKIDATCTVETDGMTADELLEARHLLQTQIDNIQYQMDEAQASKHETGEYADPTWWARAKYALRRKRQNSQALQELIAQRRREERPKDKPQDKPLAHYFMQVCQERMEPEAFEKLRERAIARKEVEQAFERAEHKMEEGAG